jgi:hypothetical protein
VALLEVLDSWEKVVELAPAEALERLGTIIRDGTVRPERLAQAAGSEPARVRERLRLILRSADEVGVAEKVPPASTPSATERALWPFAVAAA